MYIIHHYTAGVILFGEKSVCDRQGLEKVHFENYKGALSFVHVNGNHWKFLYINAVNKTVYLMDPAENATEQADSNFAAQKISERLSKTVWRDIQWKGGVMQHPTQQDNNSCGVIVFMMARAVLEAFPDDPTFTFGTSKEEMANQRKVMGCQILEGSVFDCNCAMCSVVKLPKTSLPVINWIQCDHCERWYHVDCLEMGANELKHSKKTTWNCPLCP